MNVLGLNDSRLTWPSWLANLHCMATVVEYTLEVEALKKSYGSTVALDEVDLRLVPGQITALLGPSEYGDLSNGDGTQ